MPKSAESCMVLVNPFKTRVCLTCWFLNVVSPMPNGFCKKKTFLAENAWNLTRCLMGVCIDWGEAALRETANVGECSMFFLTLSQFIHL